MAVPPMSAGPAGGMPLDPTTGADPMAAPAGSSDTVIVTISKTSDGGYMVYTGDEPDTASPSGDMSADDAAAMGPGGDAPAAAGDMSGGGAGQPAASVGAALKIAMDILNADKSSEGAPGNADDQLMAGFGSDQSPTPLRRPRQK